MIETHLTTETGALIPKDLLSEHKFSEQELLFIKYTLMDKALSRCDLEVRKLLASDDQIGAWGSIEKVRLTICQQKRECVEKMASFLGIDRDRLIELEEFVYEHETTL